MQLILLSGKKGSHRWISRGCVLNFPIGDNDLFLNLKSYSCNSEGGNTLRNKQDTKVNH
jgi:hypothetical protein